jgi:hypothetical protein
MIQLILIILTKRKEKIRYCGKNTLINVSNDLMYTSVHAEDESQ